MAKANDLAITLKAKDLMSPVIRGAKASLDNFKRDAVTGFGLASGANFAGMAADALRGFVNVMNDALRAARDLTEQQTKANYVFQEAANSVRVFAAGAAEGFGMSERAALTALGTMGNLLTAIGQTPQEAAKMSLALTKLAADVSSFNNVASEEVLRAFQAALVGEAEPARRLGVNISMARVEAEALASGLAKTKTAITDADKVTARYAIIMKDTANAQGDFARTSDNLANQQRILDANFENLSARVGGFVEGPANLFVQILNEALDRLGGPTGVNAEILKLLNSLGQPLPAEKTAVQTFFEDVERARKSAMTHLRGSYTEGIISDQDLMAFQAIGIEIDTLRQIIQKAEQETRGQKPGIIESLLGNQDSVERYAGQARRDIYALVAEVTGLRYTLAGVGMPAPEPFVSDGDLRRARVAADLLKDDQAITDRAKAMLRFQQDAKRASVVTGVLGVSMRNLAEETRSYQRALVMRGAAKDDQAISDRALAMLQLERDTKRATVVTGTYGTTLVDLVGKENRLRRARVMSAMTKDDQAVSDRAKAMIELRRDTINATVVTDTFGTSMKTAVDDAARLRSIFPGAFNWNAFWSRDLIPTADEAAQKAEDAFRAKMGSILPGAYNWNAFWSRNLVGSANKAGDDAASTWVGSFRDQMRSQMVADSPARRRKAGRASSSPSPRDVEEDARD